MIKVEDKNGSELIEAISTSTEIDKNVVKAVLKGLRENVVKCAKEDVKCYISKFISFEPRKKEESSGVAFGTPWTKPAHLVIDVDLMDTFKDDLNQ